MKNPFVVFLSQIEKLYIALEQSRRALFIIKTHKKPYIEKKQYNYLRGVVRND